ncbi:hypothetical protein Tco_0905338 [Tanacetum coccineum]
MLRWQMALLIRVISPRVLCKGTGTGRGLAWCQIRDVQIQQLRDLVSEMSSRLTSTLMQCILGWIDASCQFREETSRPL